MNHFEKTVAAATLSVGIIAGCANESEPQPEMSGVSEYLISSPPSLEQFAPCETNPTSVYIEIPDAQDIARGQVEDTMSIRHTVGPEDTVESIAACYFEQPEIGIMSLTAANGRANLRQLKPGQTIEVNLSRPMTFGTDAEINVDEITEATGLRLPLVEIIYEDLSTVRHDTRYITLPKQAPCDSGRLYHVVQPGESLDSISAAYGDTANATYAFNNILPEFLKPGHILEISDRGHLDPDNFTPPSNGFWCE